VTDRAAEKNTQNAETMIRLENLSKVFAAQDEPAVDDLSMEIYEGEIVVLVGPSGCGKTTTMKMINRIIEPTSGRIFLQGEDVTKVNPDNLRRRIGYVIQQIGLFPHMTIADNIAYGVPGASREQIEAVAGTSLVDAAGARRGHDARCADPAHRAVRQRDGEGRHVRVARGRIGNRHQPPSSSICGSCSTALTSRAPW